MRKLITFVLISSILSITSFSPFAQQSTVLPKLVINTTSQDPYVTNNKDGFVDLLASKAFHRAGVSLRIVQLPAERGLINANEGILDGDLTRIKGLSNIYKNLIRVPESIRDADFCALSKNPDISTAQDDLNKHVVGLIKGWKIYEKKMETSTKVITADNPVQLFRLLKLNRIDVALYNCINGLALSKKMNIKDVNILQPAFPIIKMYLYINNKHENLVPKISKALSDLKAEGFYDKLYREKIIPHLKK